MFESHTCRVAFLYCSSPETMDSGGAHLGARVQVRQVCGASEAIAALDAPVHVLLCETGARADELLALVREARVKHPRASLRFLGPEPERAVLWRLQQAGLDVYLRHEDGLQWTSLLESAVRELRAVRELQGAARALVGLSDMRSAQHLLREAMFLEAYRRTGENKHATARVLGLTRSAIQKIARDVSPAASDPESRP